MGRGLAVRTKTDKVDSFVLARCGALLKPELWRPSSQEAGTLQALISRRDAVAEDLRREMNRREKAAVSTPPLVLQSIDSSVSFHKAELKRLEQAVSDHIDSQPDMKQDMELLTSIPAVGPQTGAKLLAIMKTRHFRSAEQSASYLGLVPVERQSGSSILGRPRLSKTGPPAIRAVL